MTLQFDKYHGTGNDFVMIDNRDLKFPKDNVKLVAHLCDRRFGIGADGLILLEHDEETDFKMVYYNSDGNTSSMCGNGGRCIVAFANNLNVLKSSNCTFMASDGLHLAAIDAHQIINLKMQDVANIKVENSYVFLNTGSPHHVQFEENLRDLDVKNVGASIRYSSLYGASGSNINFYNQIDESNFAIRTYERGVEDETLSCGTGATAVAIAMHAIGKTKHPKIGIEVQGGKLEISFEKKDGNYTNIYLRGPATKVFSGTINVDSFL